MIGWTLEQTDYIVKHWKDGKSASTVAAMLNESFGLERSRNSVIGRLNRLGQSRGPMCARARVSKQPRIAKPPKYVAREFSPPKKLPPRPVIMADVSNAKPWIERVFGECAFPIGERGAVMSCCAKTSGTYCEAHRAAMVSSAPMTGKEVKRLERLAA